MNHTIRHSGVVKSVTQHSVIVRIEQTAACAACQAAHLCQSAEKRDKDIVVSVLDSSLYTPGQEVVVEGLLHQGLKAVAFAYVVPLVVLLAVVAVCVGAGLSEDAAALIGVATLVLYYLALKKLEPYLSKHLRFTIK